MLSSVLRVANEFLRFSPKTQFDWRSKSSSETASHENENSSPAVSLDAMESLQQTEEDLLCQQMLWGMMQEKKTTALRAAEEMEIMADELEIANATDLIMLENQITSVCALVSKVKGKKKKGKKNCD